MEQSAVVAGRSSLELGAEQGQEELFTLVLLKKSMILMCRPLVSLCLDHTLLSVW